MPNGHVVLVVEDEVLIATDVGLFLEDHGWRVLGPAPTITESLRLLQSERPTVALLDVALLDGMATVVAEALRGLNVPIILMSAYEQPEHAAGHVFAGLPNIGKPMDRGELLRLLERAAAG